MDRVKQISAEAAAAYGHITGEKIKIMVTFSQLLSALTQPEATGTEWPVEFVAFIDGLGSLVNLNIVSVARPACTMDTTFLSESFLAAGTQLGVVGLGLAAVLVSRAQGKNTQSTKQGLVLLIFIIYSGLNNTLCSVFKCTRLEDGKLHLSEDLRVICYTGTHATYAGAAAFLIFSFSFCVPVGLVAILYRAKQAGRLYAERAQGRERKPSKELAYLGSMFTRYEPHAYWFEAVHLLFKLYFSGVLVVLGSTELSTDTDSGVVGDTRAVNALQLVCAMLALLIYLLVSGLSQPYLHYGDDVQWMVSLSVLLLCAFIAMLRQAGFAAMLGVTDGTLAVLLTTMGVLPIALGAVRLLAATAAELGLCHGTHQRKRRAKVVPTPSELDGSPSVQSSSASFKVKHGIGTVVASVDGQDLGACKQLVADLKSRLAQVLAQQQEEVAELKGSLTQHEEALKVLRISHAQAVVRGAQLRRISQQGAELRAQLKRRRLSSVLDIAESKRILEADAAEYEERQEQLREEEAQHRAQHRVRSLEKRWVGVLRTHAQDKAVMQLDAATVAEASRALFRHIDQSATHTDTDGRLCLEDMAHVLENFMGRRRSTTAQDGGGRKNVAEIAADMMRTMLEAVGSECGGDGEHIEEAQFVAFFARIHARREKKGRMEYSM